MASTQPQPQGSRIFVSALKSGRLPPAGGIFQLNIVGQTSPSMGYVTSLAADRSGICLIRHSHGFLDTGDFTPGSVGIGFRNDSNVYIESSTVPILTFSPDKVFKIVTVPVLDLNTLFPPLLDAIKQSSANFLGKVIRDGSRTIVVDSAGSAIQLGVFGTTPLDAGVYCFLGVHFTQQRAQRCLSSFDAVRSSAIPLRLPFVAPDAYTFIDRPPSVLLKTGDHLQSLCVGVFCNIVGASIISMERVTNSRGICQHVKVVCDGDQAVIFLTIWDESLFLRPHHTHLTASDLAVTKFQNRNTLSANASSTLAPQPIEQSWAPSSTPLFVPSSDDALVVTDQDLSLDEPPLQVRRIEPGHPTPPSPQAQPQTAPASATATPARHAVEQKSQDRNAIMDSIDVLLNAHPLDAVKPSATPQVAPKPKATKP